MNKMKNNFCKLIFSKKLMTHNKIQFLLISNKIMILNNNIKIQLKIVYKV